MPPTSAVFSQNPAVNPAVKIARKPREIPGIGIWMSIWSSLIADPEIVLPTKPPGGYKDHLCNFCRFADKGSRCQVLAISPIARPPSRRCYPSLLYLEFVEKVIIFILSSRARLPWRRGTFSGLNSWREGPKSILDCGG
jgi:hypothetical protein